MKNYYFCNANFAVYTEIEKNNSTFPAFRFELIGQFKSRKQAENAWNAKPENFGNYATNAKRI